VNHVIIIDNNSERAEYSLNHDNARPLTENKYKIQIAGIDDTFEFNSLLVRSSIVVVTKLGDEVLGRHVGFVDHISIYCRRNKEINEELGYDPTHKPVS
jgi:hypothetical protein